MYIVYDGVLIAEVLEDTEGVFGDILVEEVFSEKRAWLNKEDCDCFVTLDEAVNFAKEER